ncbi:MAG: tRNA (adenosine(37)-N6)-dimethylallyltransferase MiaA [Deltaproteobacteria bacterium]|nr:tRNA (adenosine(37)-N6)-dimethylallyltransferase MiaA [Deltaproteobacteria bacterium]
MQPPLVVVSGPTAAGKSALALELAVALDAEIVSADSRQVYRGLDIGTAKPGALERARVPHHLIDVVDPDVGFDAARFVELARAAIAACRERRRLPLVVGGSGLYLRALCGGLAPIAGRDPALRRQLEAETRVHGSAAMHRRLAAVDPETARRVPPGDRVRIVRALEVHAATGEPLSAQQRAHGFSDRPYRVLWLVVDREPAALRQRIAERGRGMFASGLVEEAVALRRRWGAIPLLDTIGYREALRLADGELDLPAAIAATAARTRQYAKRQRTWLRREPVDRWSIDPTADELRPLIAAFVASANAVVPLPPAP